MSDKRVSPTEVRKMIEVPEAWFERLKELADRTDRLLENSKAELNFRSELCLLLGYISSVDMFLKNEGER